ncbi:MAG: response regulator transcription factor [Thermoanaerobaculia bacterium]
MSDTTRVGARCVLLIDSDPWRRESLKKFLLEHKFRVATEEEPELLPEIILLNLCERAGEVKIRVERLRTGLPDAKIVAFVREVDSHTVFPCLLLGVKGILAYDATPEEILAAMSCVASGSIWSPRAVLSQWIDRIATLGLTEATDRAFTPSEHRVLGGVRDELSNKEIARQLGITEATVKFHVGKLLRKTGTKDRRDLARFVRETVPATDKRLSMRD